MKKSGKGEIGAGLGCGMVEFDDFERDERDQIGRGLGAGRGVSLGMIFEDDQGDGEKQLSSSMPIPAPVNSVEIV